MAGKRWTADEDLAWIKFFRGETVEPPPGRDILAARRRFDIPSVGNLHSSALHAMSVAAAKFLPRIPYKGAGCHTAFIETVQRLAVHPDAVDGWGYPKNVLDEAVISARKALHETPAPAELVDG